ncbi:MAG TPA: MerR family transcriptional regulator [Geobacteraceae bacterium]|nr:MerR family transcriptional regulator [Geobacteraceae bacterium]
MTEETEEPLTSISELSTTLGLTTRTLRYWEEVGIIESAERADGAARGYSPYYVRRIKFIMKLKHLGLTIKEMQSLYSFYGDAKQTDMMIPALIKTLDEHIETLDKRVANLTALRKEIMEYRQRMTDKFKP